MYMFSAVLNAGSMLRHLHTEWLLTLVVNMITVYRGVAEGVA